MSFSNGKSVLGPLVKAEKEALQVRKNRERAESGVIPNRIRNHIGALILMVTFLGGSAAFALPSLKDFALLKLQQAITAHRADASTKKPKLAPSRSGPTTGIVLDDPEQQRELECITERMAEIAAEMRMANGPTPEDLPTFDPEWMHKNCPPEIIDATTPELVKKKNELVDPDNLQVVINNPNTPLATAATILPNPQ